MCKNFTTNNPGLTKTLQPVNGGRVKEISFSGHGASHIRHYFLCVQCAETRAIHCHTVTKAFCCSEPLKNFITKSSCLFMKILPTMIANFCGSIINCIMANIQQIVCELFHNFIYAHNLQKERTRFQKICPITQKVKTSKMFLFEKPIDCKTSWCCTVHTVLVLYSI